MRFCGYTVYDIYSHLDIVADCVVCMFPKCHGDSEILRERERIYVCVNCKERACIPTARPQGKDSPVRMRVSTSPPATRDSGEGCSSRGHLGRRFPQFSLEMFCKRRRSADVRLVSAEPILRYANRGECLLCRAG